MEAKQNGLGEDQGQKECKPKGEPSMPPQRVGYWGDYHTEIRIGLDQIIALADVMTSTLIKATDDSKGGADGLEIDLNYDTLPSIGHLIEEKAATIKTLVDEMVEEMSEKLRSNRRLV